MIFRISGVMDKSTASPGWNSFAESQKLRANVSGYISQPAHAALAGRLAASLTPQAFGQMPPEVVETVAQHDAGWSMPDLAALESAIHRDPLSFLDVSSQQATDAWRRSIRASEERSPLQAVLTSRHFCLLAPHDNDPAHEKFRREEDRHRESRQSAWEAEAADLERYTAALGFCDLLSLLMCSGLEGNFEIPLAHPAHPGARNAPQVLCKLKSGAVSLQRPVLLPGTEVYVELWTRTAPGIIANGRCEWKAE